jgi:RNA polymerase sigma-70 factor, ECF subfamily
MDDKTIPSEDLMARVAEGNDYAFEILVQRHQTSVLNLIYRYVADRTKARDLAQEVFMRVWQAARTYKPKAKFTTWIYRITANLCLNELKSEGRKKLVSQFPNLEGAETDGEAFSDESASAEERLLAEERSRQITYALQSMPENQRMALILKKYEDLSYQEISKILGCSVSAVESLLVRAKRNLQEKLTPFLK